MLAKLHNGCVVVHPQSSGGRSFLDHPYRFSDDRCIISPFFAYLCQRRTDSREEERGTPSDVDPGLCVNSDVTMLARHFREFVGGSVSCNRYKLLA